MISEDKHYNAKSDGWVSYDVVYGTKIKGGGRSGGFRLKSPLSNGFTLDTHFRLCTDSEIYLANNPNIFEDNSEDIELDPFVNNTKL